MTAPVRFLLGLFTIGLLTGCASIVPTVSTTPVGPFAGQPSDGPNAGSLSQDPKLGIVTGRILDKTGHPVKGAKVMAYIPTRAGGAVKGYRVTTANEPVFASLDYTDPNGYFHITNAPTGSVVVEATDPAASDSVVVGDVPVGSADASGSTTVPEIAVQPPATIEGRVLGAVTTDLSTVALPGTRFSTVLDSTLSYVFTAIPTGYRVVQGASVYDPSTDTVFVPEHNELYSYRVGLERPNHETKVSNSVIPGPGETLKVDLDLGVIVRGSVVAPANIATESITAVVRVGMTSTFVGPVDASGSFTVGEVKTDQMYLQGGNLTFYYTDTNGEQRPLTTVRRFPDGAVSTVHHSVNFLQGQREYTLAEPVALALMVLEAQVRGQASVPDDVATESVTAVFQLDQESFEAQLDTSGTFTVRVTLTDSGSRTGEFSFYYTDESLIRHPLTTTLPDGGPASPPRVTVDPDHLVVPPFFVTLAHVE